MGALLGVPTPAEPKSLRNRRTGAGKEPATATDKQTVPDVSVGVADNATGAGTTVTSRKSLMMTAIPTEPYVHIPQCGLEDEPGLQPWEPGPRIRQTRLSPEEQAKFRALLDLIFSKNIVLGQRLNFEPDDIMEVMKKVIPYLESEPMLIEDLPFDVTIVGDLHGQLHDLARIFKIHAKDGKSGWESRKYVFLGNYVDRGRQSLEVVMALFCIKMLYPDDIFLLRGNHEFIEMNAKHGFCEEIIHRYEGDSKKLYFQINEAFFYLSAAAILGNIYLCVHAGISTGAFTRRAMRGIYKPIINSGDDMFIHDVAWSDPAPGLRGTVFNAARGTSFAFGLDYLAYAMACMEVKVVFRGHTLLAGGHAHHNHCLQSIYSATDHREAGNKGAVADLDAEGKLTVVVLEVDEKRSAWERVLRELDGEEPYVAANAHRVDDWIRAKRGEE